MIYKCNFTSGTLPGHNGEKRVNTKLVILVLIISGNALAPSIYLITIVLSRSMLTRPSVSALKDIALSLEEDGPFTDLKLVGSESCSSVPKRRNGRH